MRGEPHVPEVSRFDHGARFPRALRIGRRPEFRKVFDTGRSRSEGGLIVYARPRDEGGPSRLGLVVGRKYGSSPERNRWKRHVREAFRTHHPELPPSHDFVVLPTAGSGRSTVEGVAAALVKAAGDAARTYVMRGPRTGRKR